MPKSPRKRRVAIFAIVAIVLLVALAAAWRWTPLGEFAEPKLIARWLRIMADSAWLPVLIAVVYVAANAVMFPNTVLCFATILALGSWQGFLYATGASMLSAWVTYAMARRYGPERLRDLKIKSIDRVSSALQKGGVVQITLLRLLPLAPFTVVNIMAGMAKVRLIPYLLGTLFGLLPGNLLFTAFGRQFRQLLTNPTPGEIGILAAITVMACLAMWYLQRLTAPAAARR